mgnify:CR=1 FL=1
MNNSLQQLKEDYKNITGEEAPIWKIFLRRKISPAMHFLFWFRIRQKYKKRGGYIFNRVLKNVGIKYGFDIPYETEIGGGLKISHPGFVVINPKTIIGKNCHIVGGVVIGKKKGKAPVIGDNVHIGANATIIGGIKIGNNSVIGAGAVVVKDVPENAVVVGNPARVIKYNE